MDLNNAMINLFDRIDGFYDKHLGHLENTDFYKEHEKTLYNSTFLIPFVGAYRVTKNCCRLAPTVNDALDPTKDVYKIDSKETLKDFKRSRRLIISFGFPIALRLAQFQTLMYALNSKSPLGLVYYTFWFCFTEGASTYLEIMLNRETKDALSRILSKK